VAAWGFLAGAIVGQSSASGGSGGGPMTYVQLACYNHAQVARRGRRNPPCQRHALL